MFLSRFVSSNSLSAVPSKEGQMPKGVLKDEHFIHAGEKWLEKRSAPFLESCPSH